MNLRRILKPLIDKAHSRLTFFKKPRTRDEVEDAREILAKIYFTLAGFTIVALTIYVGVAVPFRSAEDVAHSIENKDPIRIIKFKGFKKVKDYVYNSPADDSVPSTQLNEHNSKTQSSESPEDNLENID